MLNEELRKKEKTFGRRRKALQIFIEGKDKPK